MQSTPRPQHPLLRKPLPTPPTERIRPLTKINPADPPPRHSQQAFMSPPPHAHNRSASSGSFPVSPLPQQAQNYSSPPAAASHLAQQQAYQGPAHPPGYPAARRTLSNATTSTSSMTNGNMPMRQNSGNSGSLQRSISSRSGGGGNSYVALMRRQKATVWSDRAQQEDPRTVAAIRAAKLRAVNEISRTPSHLNPPGAGSGTSSLTGNVRSKIRHHGAPKAQPFTYSGSSVPIRLSAREVDDEDAQDKDSPGLHARSGSGRSSQGSAIGRQALGQLTPNTVGTPAGRSSEGSTPPQTRPATGASPDNRTRTTTHSSVPSEPTPVPENYRQGDYFAKPRNTSSANPANPGDQGSSGDDSTNEKAFGNVDTLPHHVREVPEKDEDLQRRGSVDERSMTMRGLGKLYVANPDLSD